jgi:hypothetical protein
LKFGASNTVSTEELMQGFDVQTKAQSATRSARKRSLKLRAGWLLAVVAAAAWTLTACVGEISDPDSTPGALSSDPGSNRPGAAPGSPKGTSSSSPAGASTGSAASGTNTPGAAAPSCTGPAAAPAPLSRLTNLEYRNTLTALFPGVALTSVELPADNIVEGFDNNAKAQTPSTSLIEQYRSSAQAVAASVTANLAVALPCKPTTSAEQDACGKQWIDAFVPRAYRRPITSDERTRLDGFFASSKTSYDFPTAISMVVQAVLQSPHFLYRVELGGVAQNGVAALSGFEMASRLSYFFWDTMPDDTLTAAAASGALDNVDGVEAQARRLLADAKSHPAVASLFHQWLRFDKMDKMNKSASAFPSWSDDVAASLRGSAGEFVDRVFWDLGGSLPALLTDTATYVDANIAPIYGLPPIAKTSATMALTDTNKAQRSGILTQAGLMAAFAHETTDSPVLRGVFVLDRLLCSAPPPPPASVTGSITETTDSSQVMTTRDRFAMTHESGTCAGCHHMIDGFGFGFEHYDAIGKWRDTESNLPINAKGWISGTRDANGDFDGAVDLGQRLSKSGQVSDCVASQWYRYSLGLGAADVNTCDLAPVSKAFSDSDGDMQELMIATVTSDAFRRRPEVKP